MIKQPIFAIIALVLLVVVGWFVMNRIAFLRTAERTTGNITSIDARNDRCGGRRSRHDCTRFTAHVQYMPRAGGGSYSISLSAGSAYWYDQPISKASRHIGQRLTVVYSPKNPSEAYEDTLFGVWGTPIMVAFMQIASLFTSFTEPRRRAKSI